MKYFFHRSDARMVGPMLEVRAEAGWEGYGIAWAILERIADGELRTLPMNDLREFMLESKMPPQVLLKVLKVLELEGVIAKKEIRDEEFGGIRFFHYWSPVLEEQLQSKELQRMAKAIDPREKTHRPAIPKDVRAQVLAPGCCAYCGATEDLQVDHIYPYSKGGAHSIENFQPLCKPCNYAKRDKTEEQYFALIGRTHGTPHPN